jgi:hypothetical protein
MLRAICLVNPVDVVAPQSIQIGAVEHPCQHEQQVGQAVQEQSGCVVHHLRAAQGHHRPFGAPGHGAADMGQRRTAGAGGQDELLQARQPRVVVFQGLVEGLYRLGLQQLEARHGQLASQIEQLVLDLHQQLAHLRGQGFRQQHSKLGVQFVHLTDGLDAQVVLRHAAAVAQPGAAVVAGAGADLCESIAHPDIVAPAQSGSAAWGRVTGLPLFRFS